MVTRKPVAPPLTTSSSPPQPKTNGNPPYPTSPQIDSAKSTGSGSLYSTDLKKSPAFDLIDVGRAQRQQRRDSDASSHGTWDSDDSLDQDHETPEEVEVPKPLQIRPSSQDMRGAATKEDSDVGLPAILRIGPQGGGGPSGRKSMEGQRYEDEAQSNPWADRRVTPSPPSSRPDSNNPYLQKNNPIIDNSQSEWQEVKSPPLPAAAPPPIPAAAPPPPPDNTAFSAVELSAVHSPPASDAPSAWLSEMSLSDHRPASWETAEVLDVPQNGQAPFPPPTSHYNNAEREDSRSSTWWQESSQPSALANDAQIFAHPSLLDSVPEPEYQPPSGPPPSHLDSSFGHEEVQKSPPRDLEPINTHPSASTSTSPVPDTPGTQLKKQRNQHYQIKHVNWLDSSSSGRPNMRHSPVLTQNANGPCPLLALVNALVLSTPSDLDTALIETLRTREQVSLGLLLDAVFDELMSGRRNDPANQLPDVGELYSFLLALHTGMNVNPRFVTPTDTPRGSLDGHPRTLNSVHPTHRAQRKAGAFEETKEMRLYSTFNVPLIHGWTAPADTPAYEAFVRSAQTFEDAQNIQFLEAELEDKLQSEGLPPQEQQVLQDIQTIKAFLSTWPTQLSDFGLQTISDSLVPGQFAILFRNDHFSTIYKEPKHGALMTLVTDAGYASHDEIVWESLVDVNGAAAEMFSGDFRVVSHNQDARLNQGSSGGGEAGWQTVPSRNKNPGKQTDRSGDASSANKFAADGRPPLPGPRPGGAAGSDLAHNDIGIPDSEANRKASEQEDHDLALALQLQEEEEDQQRQADERRRREQELSERFLSNETEGPRPTVPPRRTGGRTGGGPTTAPAARTTATTPRPRPAVNRSTDDPSDPEAPPSYEQAASDQPYRPAGSTATGTMAQGNPLGAYDALRRQHTPASPIAAQSPSYQTRRQSNANRLGRRQSSMPGPAIPGSYAPPEGPPPPRVGQAPGVKDADERCVVM